jgi:adenosylmethionine-8-amino-7-oxononanoate aminotransferase
MESTIHCHFAGRRPAGTDHAVTLAKDGVRHRQRLPNGSEREIIACGLACSECFSGTNLHRILQPGFELEQKVMEDLMLGKPATPLSIHTSSGVTDALAPFLEALELHLPWKNKEELDWCVSLQLEGASAVFAAIDMVLQVRRIENTDEPSRIKVAVGATSYHGPPSTSFGAKTPIWSKNNQVIYPVPTAYGSYDEEELFKKYEKFLNENAHEIGVMLIEPQWGSSQAALPWPKHILKQYVQMARDRGIKIICDEIMCGLGRHGKGTLFLSEAWDLDPDAVTFGKAVATGLFPLAGAILKRGRDVLHAKKCSVMQSHTYAGSSTRALMAATEVLKEFVNWLPSVSHLGEEMGHIMRFLSKMSNGMFICHGQGLMWGGVVSYAGQNHDPIFRGLVVDAFKQNCEDVCIIPYFVPVGGFMCTPVIDIDVATIYEIGQRLEEAIQRTMDQVGWIPVTPVGRIELSEEEQQEQHTPNKGLAIASASTINLNELVANKSRGSLFMEQDLGNNKCVPYLHATKCCTSCGSFVSLDVRSRFVLEEDQGETKEEPMDGSGISF